jgi:hypothetical protein
VPKPAIQDRRVRNRTSDTIGRSNAAFRRSAFGVRRLALGAWRLADARRGNCPIGTN